LTGEDGMNLETSLVQSTVTNQYMITQVSHTKGEPIESFVTFTQCIAEEFWPFLERISRGEEP